VFWCALTDVTSFYSVKSGDDGEQEVSSAGLVELKTQPKSYAEESLPKGLELRTVLTRHGPSVFATERITKFTCFGPLVGQRVREMDISDEAEMKYLWEVNVDLNLVRDSCLQSKNVSFCR